MSGDLKNVVERMKAEAEKESAEARADGAREGAEWAKEAATPKQLKRLARACDSCTRGADDVAAYDVAALIEGDEGEPSEFWACALGENQTERSEDVDFRAGFIEGALEVWVAVREQL